MRAVRELRRWPGATREHWRSLPQRRTRIWVLWRLGLPPIRTLALWLAAISPGILEWGPGSYKGTLPVLLLIVFALWLLPPLVRGVVMPLTVLALALAYPYYVD